MGRSRHPSAPPGVGFILKEARVAKGISREAMAQELSMPLWMIEAIETEGWRRLPAGRERPLARRLAEVLEVDLAQYAEEWEALPGGLEQEAPDPRREMLERILMVAFSIGSVALLVWLVVPGPDLKGSRHPAAARTAGRPQVSTWTSTSRSSQPYPVLGEVLPEAPINAEGVLVLLRAMDTCECHIITKDQDLTHSLRVSEPWKLRVQGPFTLRLDNAGVVSVEVAGRRIRHGQSVGDAWTGRFGEDGAWLVPVERPSSTPPTAPETEIEE